MSTAVMTTNTIYEFGELLLKQQQQQQKQSVAGWERAPGAAHEPLTRRASVPVSAGPTPSVASLVTSLLLDLNSHRRLDRSHSAPDSTKSAINVNTSRYKTELCRPFEENGECKYGDKCQFAHGMHELRNLMRHPKYKTELCRTFHTVGFCPYGPRCHFIHNAEEARGFQGQGKNRPHPLCLIPGPGSSAETPSPPSSLGSVSPPPSSTSTSNTAFSFAPLVHSLDSPCMTPSPCHSPPPAPGSPDSGLPVFSRLRGPGHVLSFQFGGELLA